MTEIAKHTPGPWKVDVAGRQIKIRPATDNGSSMATMTTYYLNRYRKANARLMAAAPDLLAALQALVERGTDSPEHRAAEAAIAKATSPLPAPGEGK